MQFAVPLLAALAAVLSYRFFDTWSRRTWLPAGLRAVGWSSLALLLINASCPAAPASVRPIVLLDGSLSMQAAGGRWRDARELAAGLGEVRLATGSPGDTLPLGGRSRLAPAVIAAEATGRPVIVVTDGEVEDGAALLGSPALPAIRLVPRRAVPDVILTRVTGDQRLTAADSLRLDLELRATGGVSPGRRLALEVREGSRVWLRGAAVLDSGGRARATLSGPVPPVAPGAHVLRVAITGAAEAEPRTDARLWVVHLLPTPGIVVLASTPSWESRFLMATIRDVAAVPVRGYLEIEPDGWRHAGSLLPASASEVAEAARRADLVVALGPPGNLARSIQGRARWLWPPASPNLGGDWYLMPGETSPISGILAGLAFDSFPPGTALADVSPPPNHWVALSAQLGRQGPVRPVVFGGDSAGVRRAVTAIEGLWRWAFRGGSSEQGYRALVAATVSWLLLGTDTTRGVARLQREVVAQGLPAVFQWSASGNPVPLGVHWVGEGISRRDTLRFDGAGRAETILPPGIWRYRLDRGGEGTLAVEEFSEELVPSPVTLVERNLRESARRMRRPMRGWIWLFALSAAAFAGEWTVRRRFGFR